MPTTPHSSRGPCGSYMGSSRGVLPPRVQRPVAVRRTVISGSGRWARARHDDTGPAALRRATANAKVRPSTAPNPHSGSQRRCARALPRRARDHRPMARRAERACSRHDQSPREWTMLRIVRALGFLAPIAVASVITVVAEHSPGTATGALALQRPGGAGRGAGMTTMALAGWSYVGWRLNRIAARWRDPRRRPAGPSARGRHPRRAAPGARLQRRQRRLRAGRGARHPRPPDRRRQPRDPAHDPGLGDRARRRAITSWLSVAFIDIDRFKPINDTYGHNSGDAVLRQIANADRRQHPRVSDLFGRYGGEEFMLILPETTPEEATVLAEQLRQLVMDHPLSDRRRPARCRSRSASAWRATSAPSCRPTRWSTRPMPPCTPPSRWAATAPTVIAAVDDDAPVRRAPISAERRAAATAIGQWASDTAAEALASVLAPQPHHRGQPVGHDRRAGDRDGAADGPAARGDRAHPDRQPAARPRQAGRAARRSWTSRPPCPTGSGRRSASTRASGR